MRTNPLVWWCMCKTPLASGLTMRIGNGLYARCSTCTCVVLTMKLVSPTMKGTK